MKQDIRLLSLSQLKDHFTQMGEKPFRAKQVWEWLWMKSCTRFDEMTNLSLSLREALTRDFEIRPVTINTQQHSADGTVKSAFCLHDKELVEGVLIPSDDRMTACVSSQVGCSLSCKFCATGYMDRKRNLDPAEIYDQVVLIDRQAREKFGLPLTNIVYMGMGEPLLNYANVLESIARITGPDGLNLSPKRITLSTAGIAKMIRKLADDQVRFNLALSLHAANDEKRNQIMPINETNSLEALREALLYFYEKTKNKITFEYIVFRDFNDTLKDAEDLWKFARQIPSKINIIEYNPIAEASFINTGADKLSLFEHYLQGKGLIVNVRKSRGKDIDAACGQLANKG
ncbi:MAG: 23S rRNA (adenine(2503)-C(2))-methyltransferase RlmN [Cyclobacteriaceae bacterium]|nr:23S rRNA (adenine(2503)-C(2))-methyltransferase RlmN [Cyclobacteriaceae bacterium]